MKHLIHVACAYTFGAVGIACANGVWHGTYFLLYTTDDLAVVAIDSRLTFIDGVTGHSSSRDDHCKMFHLDDYTVFVIQGVRFNNVPNTPAFDAAQIAKSAYDRQSSPIDLHKLAADWSDEMTRLMDETYPLSRSTNPGGDVMSQIVFVGHNGTGKVHTVHAQIRLRQGTNDKFEASVQEVQPGMMRASGHLGIIQELESLKTERAKALRAANQWKTFPEAWAAKVQGYVKAVRDWSDDSSIGGEVATVILERGKKWRWFNRPSFCPEK